MDWSDNKKKSLIATRKFKSTRSFFEPFRARPSIKSRLCKFFEPSSIKKSELIKTAMGQGFSLHYFPETTPDNEKPSAYDPKFGFSGPRTERGKEK